MGKKTSVKICYTIEVDAEIAAEVRWLNQQGVKTEASCCGHGEIFPTALIKPSSIAQATLLGYDPEQTFDGDGNSTGLFQIQLGRLDSIALEEIGRQPYQDCAFSAGLITGHPHDAIYLMLERRGNVDLTLYLRTDEAQAVVWLLAGALWSREMGCGGQ